jgi:hypothetical protein
MTTRTIVIYGTTDKDGKNWPTFTSLKKHAEEIQSLRDSDDHLLEEFEADSWGHAMTYYRAKYFGSLYQPSDPNVWLVWPDEVASVDKEVLIERSLDLLEHSGLVYRAEPAQTFAVISGIMTKLEESLEEVAECMQDLGDTP